MPDPVKHPSHYTCGKVEAIDVIHDALGDAGFAAFCQGNVLKYAIRARYKANPAQDMAKAAVYAEWASKAFADTESLT